MNCTVYNPTHTHTQREKYIPLEISSTVPGNIASFLLSYLPLLLYIKYEYQYVSMCSYVRERERVRVRVDRPIVCVKACLIVLPAGYYTINMYCCYYCCYY